MRDVWNKMRKTPWAADFWHIFPEEGGNIPPPLMDFLAQEGAVPFLDLILQENGSRIKIT